MRGRLYRDTKVRGKVEMFFLKIHILMDYSFSDSQTNAARVFARARLPTSLVCYKSRRANSNEDKIYSDIANGALGEMAAEHMLQTVFGSYATSVSSPDFTVYETAEKSFDPDLVMTFGDTKIKTHVKSFLVVAGRTTSPLFAFKRSRVKATWTMSSLI